MEEGKQQALHCRVPDECGSTYVRLSGRKGGTLQYVSNSVGSSFSIIPRTPRSGSGQSDTNGEMSNNHRAVPWRVCCLFQVFHAAHLDWLQNWRGFAVLKGGFPRLGARTPPQALTIFDPLPPPNQRAAKTLLLAAGVRDGQRSTPPPRPPFPARFINTVAHFGPCDMWPFHDAGET